MNATDTFDATRTFDVFFYGLFMDPDELAARGAVPRRPRLAFIDDHAVVLGERAMLMRRPGARAYGMLYALRHGEMDLLYADSRADYAAEAFSVGLAGGGPAQPRTPALAMVHRSPPLGSAPEPGYARRWRAIEQRLGIGVAAAADSDAIKR